MEFPLQASTVFPCRAEVNTNKIGEHFNFGPTQSAENVEALFIQINLNKVFHNTVINC